MISLSPRAKEAYAKYVGPDGKLRIDETVPENLRETFQFFNDNNINVLELNIEKIYNDAFDDEPSAEDTLNNADDEITEEDLMDVSFEDDDEDVDTNLDDMFSDL